MIEADVFGDGHDAIGALLRHRKAGARRWVETRMTPIGNDRWRAEFVPDTLGVWQFEIEGWQDHFATWLDGLEKKVAAEVDVSMDLLIGADLVTAASARARGKASRLLKKHATDARRSESGVDRAPRRSLLRGAHEHHGHPSRPVAGEAIAAVRRDSRPGAGPLLHLVRAVPALVVRRPGTARHLRRRHQAAVLCRRHGFRRALPASDPSDRDHVPQRPQQQAGSQTRGPGRALGHRLVPGRPHRHSSRPGDDR